MQKTTQKYASKQKLVFNKTLIFTSVSPVECHICGKGLSDGYSVTAKSLPNGNAFFCSVHFELQ